MNKTKDFLNHFPDFWIMTLDDKAMKGAEPKRKVDWSIQKELGKNFTEELLRDWNKKGAGIFFTPNRFIEQRTIEKCEGVTAWIVECDDLSKEEQYENLCNAELPPSIMVETKNSIHAYWLAKEGSIENYKKIVKGLIVKFQGDPACKDISRVFRVPGYNHNKQEPFLVNLLYADFKVVYTEEQMLKAFPFKEKEYKVKTINKPIKDGLGFWEAASRLSNKEMLLRASGSTIMNGETISFRARPSGGEYIDINGEQADCWIDKDGLIGSGKGAAPTYIQWFEWYGWSKGDISKWIKENCKDLLPDSAFKSSKPKLEDFIIKEDNNDFSELEGIKNPYTWGTIHLDQKISPLEKGNYIVLVGETGSGKTAFCFDVAIKNSQAGQRVLFLTLEMTKEQLYQRIAKTYAKITKDEWRTKIIPEEKLIAYKEKKKWIGNVENLDIQGFGSGIEITLEVMSDYLKKVKDQYDMVFIDNFGFISPGRSEQLQHEARVSRFLAGFSTMSRMPIVLLHHFKKGKDSKIRSINSIKGSSKFAHDSDNVIQVWRNLEDDPEITKIIEMKDRGWGIGGLVDIKFNKGTFEDLYGYYK